MKRNLLLLIVLCCTMSMMAQNGKISYQAVVRDSENHLVYDTELQVTVALANSATGAAVYSELHNVTSNANGLISLMIGDGQNKQGHWEDVHWNTAWVTATIRKASDQTFLAEHHLPLSAVPYALYADEVDTLFLQNYLTTHDYGNDDYVTHEQLNDTLAAYYDTTQVKTAIHDTADALRAMMGDAAYNSKITLKKNNVDLDSFRLNQQTDKAINIPVPTTVAELSDASNYVTKTKLNDTLGAYYDTANVKQMLKPYLKANELCDSIVKCGVIKDMRDSLGNAFDTLSYYYTSKKINDTLKAYFDSSRVKSVISDTADAIRAAIPASQVQSDWTETDNTKASFIQNKPQIPAKISDLVNDSRFADTTADNHFTGTNTVPSGYHLSGANATNNTNCGNIVVNACDLWAVFDSLMNRIDSVSQALVETQNDLEELKNSTSPVFGHLELTDITATAITATASFSSIGAPITSYDFCIKRSDVLNAPEQCFTSTSNVFTFNNLDSYTPYSVTVSATNMAGTTSSNAANARTLAKRPNGELTAETSYPNGIHVTVEHLDFGGAPSGEVKVYYKKQGSAVCGNNVTEYTDSLTSSVNLTPGIDNVFEQTIENLESSVAYCVMVKLSNADSSRLCGPQLVESGSALSLTLTSNTNEGTLDVCENDSVAVLYEATPSIGTPNEYSYKWSVVGTSKSQNTENNNTVEFFHTVGHYTISCTATSNTNPGVKVSNTYSVTVTNSGHVPTFSICSDSLRVNLSNILYADTVTWGDNTKDNITSNSAEHDYATSNVYTIAVKNSHGCVATKVLPIGLSTLHPCKVSSKNTNEDGTGNTINSLQDIDGNWYAVAQIGNQCWMKSNLRTTRYSDGTAIANGTGTNTDNTMSHTTAYYYKPNPSSHADGSYDLSKYNFNTYGLYYNWKATMRGAESSDQMPSGVQGVCPDGWHVPSLKEWDSLIARVQLLPNATYYDHHSIGYMHVLAGGCEWDAASDGRPGHYKSPARNSSEFSAIPAGEAAGLFRYNQVNDAIPQAALFWTSTASTPFSGSPRSYDFEFYDGQGTVRKDQSYNIFGYSVRCVRDYEVADPTDKPTVTTMDATNVGLYTATISGSINSPSGVIVVAKGFKWKEAASSEYNTEYLNSDDLTFNLTDLSAGTEYSYFTFAIYDDGTAFGAEKTFTTWAKPTVSTGDITDISVTTATLHGTLTNPNGVSISSKGFEWKTQNSDYQRIEIEGTENAFSYNFTGNHSTAYTVRTFVEFDGGSAIGGEISFVTKTPPTVTTTQSLSYVGANAATMSGSISALGNVSITERGIELKVKGASDETYVKIPDTGTESSFSVEKLGLAANTDYIYRAYAKYEGGTAYGTAYEFKTKTEPTVTTESATGIGMKNATLNGSYTNDGAVNITSKGFEWTTSTFDHATSASVSSNDLTYDLTGLSKSTEYKFRAFVMFDGRTVYGNEETFSTNDAPEVTTSGANNVTTNAAQLGGTVAAHDNTIIAQGFLWKASESSSPYDTITQVAVSGNTITYDLTGLTSNTNYTYCAFARTADTTVYGASQDFTTHGAPTVETQEATGVGVKTATLNGTYIQPVNVTITSKGFVWALSTVEGYTDTVKCDNLTYNLTGLAESMEYKFNAFVVFDGDTLYSTAKTFSTKVAPTVITGDATNKGVDTVRLNGTVTANSNTLLKKGFVWKATGSEGPYDTITQVTESGETMTFDLHHLAYNKNYTYHAFATTADTTVQGEEKEFTTPNPVLGLTSNNPSGQLAVCAGGSKSLTFTAAVKEGETDYTEEYTYMWDVPSGVEYTVDKNTCTVVYTATGSYTVSCTAEHNSGASMAKDSTVTVEASEGATPTFTTCEDGNTRSVTIKSQSNVGSFDWGGEGTPSEDAFTYVADGVYTITAINGECAATKTISIGNKTVRPCTTDASHPAQTDITGGGYNGAPDGLETVENGKITSVTDYDGNVYSVVQIGSQCWLAENMRCTHSPSTGTYIVNPENKTGNGASGHATTKHAQWLLNDSASYAAKNFGLLYNWCAAVDTFSAKNNGKELPPAQEVPFDPGFTGNRRGICPKGWHVPTDTEWIQMEYFVMGSDVVCDNLYRGDHAVKLSSGCDWTGDNPVLGKPHDYANAYRNAFGFCALPAGESVKNDNDPGTFEHYDYKYTFFWTSTYVTVFDAYYRKWGHENTGVYRSNSITTRNGLSVRCIRDAESVPMVITRDASNIGLDTATLNGYVEANGIDIIEYGFEWIEPNEDTHQVVASVVSANNFTAKLDNLDPSTTYSYRAYVKTSDDTYYYGYHSVNFTTKRMPTVTTANAIVTGPTTVTLNGSFSNPDNIQIVQKGFVSKQTVGGTYTPVSGAGTGIIITADLSGLIPNTGYKYKAFIMLEGVSDTLFGDEETFTTASFVPSFVCGSSTVSDYDGNPYETVPIGNQCWMKRNMRTEHYADGTAILNTYYNYPNSGIDPDSCGFLYQWTSVMNNEQSSNKNPSGVQGICPNNWHVPSLAEWQDLNVNVSAYQCNGDIAKALAENHSWGGSSTNDCSPCYNQSENNLSGFSAIPAGFYLDGVFDEAKYAAYFWTSSLQSENYPYYIMLSTYYPDQFYFIQEEYDINQYTIGFSVRCVRDKAKTITGEVSSIGETTATVNASYTNPDNEIIISKGFEYKAAVGGTYIQILGTGSGNSFEADLEELSMGTEYIYRAFITIYGHDNPIYGDEKMFVTSGPRMSITEDNAHPRICTDGSVAVVYTATIMDGESDVSNNFYYTWDIPVGLQHVDDATICTVTYSVTGSYTLTCTATPKGGGDALEPILIDVNVKSNCFCTVTNRLAHEDGPDDITVTSVTLDEVSYGVVNINGQCWMRENLRTTNLHNGTATTPIDLGDAEHISEEVPYYYDYISSGIDLERRGYLYNWAAVMNEADPSDANQSNVRGICPEGWHVPSLAEWEELDIAEYQCSNGEIDKALAANTDWVTGCADECSACYDLSENNLSGFSAIPAGYFDSDFKEYGVATEGAFYWTSSTKANGDAYSIEVSIEYHYDPSAGFYGNAYGMSVRCVRDLE